MTVIKHAVDSMADFVEFGNFKIDLNVTLETSNLSNFMFAFP